MVTSHVSDANWNGSRFRREDRNGFYESYFQRANHPTRPLAFWIRYTVFSPRGLPDAARGELWAIYFDGETNRTTAVRESVPVANCKFSPSHLSVQIGEATLTNDSLRGRAASGVHALEWAMEYDGHDPPLLLLPQGLYAGGFPKAKALVGTPNALYSGTLTVDGEQISVDGWRGSQNHNWGSRHTDTYAWGQVAGFDNAPASFLECTTARVKLGPIWSPRLTFVVLRDEGEEIVLNDLLQAVRASARFDFFTWTIDSRNTQTRVTVRIDAPAAAFIGLRYDNPPGGAKTCLNTKLASAEMTVHRPARPARTLVTKHRAAFEILTDRADHGVTVLQ